MNDHNIDKGYADLYAALNKIPDKNLQKRVYNAIYNKASISTQSGEVLCCNCKKSITSVSFTSGTTTSTSSTTTADIYKDNIYKKSLFKTSEKSTQTTKSDLLQAIDIELSHEDKLLNLARTNDVDETKVSSQIISGKEIKLGRAKRVNIPHVKKTNPDNNHKNSNNTVKSSLKKKIYVKKDKQEQVKDKRRLIFCVHVCVV